MLDVLTKLREIAQSKPELVKDALENVERTNPKDVNEGALKQAMHDDAEKMSKEEFLKKYPGSESFWHSINGYDESINKSTMENKEKEVVKEAIQITTDSPQEAGMMMQILKLAGVQPVDAKMMGMEPKQDMDHGHDDDEMGTMQMAKMRDMMSSPDDEKADETYSNTPDEKTQDTDTLVNFHSGGLNRQKATYPKVASGDNPMAMAKEDKITEEELANSLRTQYESFKQAYQEAAKPDYIDLDKDGNKTEPMKKAAKDAKAKKDK